MKKNTPGNNHTNWHHIVPTSIGGPEHNSENKYLWDIKKHRAYHQLFQNYAPSIVIGIINGWTDEEGKLNKKLINHRDRKLWRKVFSDQEPIEAIKFVQENFLPIEEKYLRGELREVKKNGFKRKS